MVVLVVAREHNDCQNFKYSLFSERDDRMCVRAGLRARLCIGHGKTSCLLLIQEIAATKKIQQRAKEIARRQKVNAIYGRVKHMKSETQKKEKKKQKNRSRENDLYYVQTICNLLP